MEHVIGGGGACDGGWSEWDVGLTCDDGEGVEPVTVGGVSGMWGDGT